MTGRPVPRDLQARIVDDLARGHRSISSIADRHHVPADLVFKLRDLHGPGLADLSEAAKRLRKPEPPVAPPAAPAKIAELVAEVCPPAKDPKPYRDGLTGDERAKCRAWAESCGLLDPAKRPAVMLKRAVVEAWRAEDCPDASARPLEPVPDAVATPDDGVVDASVVCGTCGVPLPDPWGDSCPSCGALFAPAVAGAAPEQVKTAENPEGDEQSVALDTRELDWHIQPTQPPAPWHDWADLMVRAEGVHAVSMEWNAAIGAVEMLRDALAEHEHREAMVQRIAEQLANFDGSPDSASVIARRILDAIEAA